NKTQTVFRTQTHKGQGFNELRFDDATDNQLLHLHAQKDMDVHVLNDKLVNVEHDSKYHIKNDNHLKIDNEYRVLADNDISLSTNTDLHINADKGIYAQGKNEIHLQTNSKVVIDAGVEITLQASGNYIKIDSTGIHTSPKFSIGSGSASAGSGWRGKLPGTLFKEPMQIFPLSRNQRLALISDTPFCEECEKCKQEGGCAI
ncbi:type VI secretion system tip protein VgrG, partial [Frischella perrara]